MRHLTDVGDAIWLAVARKEIGVREGTHDGRIIQYHQTTRLKARSSKIPWCASFVCWCLQEARVPHPRSARAADFLDYGRATYPEPGCIVVFGKRDPDAGGSGHVGFLVGVDGDQLLVLSGNCGNAVKIKAYDASACLGYRWPVVP